MYKEGRDRVSKVCHAPETLSSSAFQYVNSIDTAFDTLKSVAEGIFFLYVAQPRK